MSKAQSLQPSAASIKPSLHLIGMLEDPAKVRRIAASADDFDDVLRQIQLDIATPENRDLIGPTVLALRHVQDVLALFRARNDLNESTKKENAP